MRKIVIAPYVFHKGLISFYQQKDPFYDVKIISKEDIFSEVYGKIGNDEIAQLLLSDLDINQIKEIYRFIPFANSDSENIKVHSLYEYNKDLKEKGFLKENPYFFYLLKDKEIEIIGYSEDDAELKAVLEKLGFSYKFSYGLDKYKKHNVIKYKNLLLESLDLLNNIAAQIKKGKKPNDIYIYTNNKNLLSFLKQSHKSFNVPINFSDSVVFSNTNSGKSLMEAIDNSESLDEIKDWVAKKIDDTFKNDLLKLIEDNEYDFLDFSKEKELLKYVISSFRIRPEKYDNAVKIISKPIFIENATIFVPAFVQGSFPTVFKDNEYISDKEKVILGLNDSKVSTKISYWENITFFDSNNEFCFSYSSEYLNETFSVSPILTFLGYSEKENSIPSVFYSEDYRIYIQTIYFDLFNIFKKRTSEYESLKDFKIDYKTYDNSFTKVNHFNDKTDLVHSYTSISEYYECPFKYYLNNVLRVNKEDYGFGATIGKICHKVFEHMFDDGFDFDSCFNKFVSKYELNALEVLIINALKDQVKKAVHVFLLHRYQYMAASYVKNEQTSVIEIDERTKLLGRMDATYVINNEYLTIIDYKSGDKDSVSLTDIDYGLCLQLPIYACLSRHDKELSKYKIGGLYLQKFIDKSYAYKIKDDAMFRPILKLDGLSNIDYKYLENFDYTFRDNMASQFISALTKKKDGGLKASPKQLSDSEFEQLADKAENLVKEADKKIRNNEFNIAPLIKGTTFSACQYCPNKDICFVRSNQYNIIEKEEKQ